MATLPNKIIKQIDDAVSAFEPKRRDFENDATILQTRLLGNLELRGLVHSSQWRAKEPSHLRHKLIRKAEEALKGDNQFDITSDNVFDRISDLAGVRLLHLHMRQMEKIHPLIIKTLKDEGYVLKGGKQEAKTWDPEYAAMFKELGLKVTQDPSFYTSVHYIIKQNKKTPRQCELQVRTLSEELWGEISHTINYPRETDSIACKEQIKALARFVSGCSRLVDSIVRSYEDHCQQEDKKRAKKR